MTLTGAGREALELVRIRYRERMRACLGELHSDEIDALERAVRATGSLVDRLQRNGVQ